MQDFVCNPDTIPQIVVPQLGIMLFSRFYVLPQLFGLDDCSACWEIMLLNQFLSYCATHYDRRPVSSEKKGTNCFVDKPTEAVSASKRCRVGDVVRNGDPRDEMPTLLELL